MAAAAADVELQRVVKRFDDVTAVDGVSLEIPSTATTSSNRLTTLSSRTSAAAASVNSA